VQRSNARAGRRLRRAGWIVALGAALAGCATVNPSTGASGIALPGAAAGGAAAGWISGESSKQSLRRAAASAGVAELAGGSVSYYMDVQESKLHEQLDGSGVGVVRKGNDITLSLPANLAFASDSAELSAGFGGVLDTLAVALKKYDKTVIEVAGHTDSTGSREHNQALSEQRAAAVATYLEKRGVLKSRVLTIGAGETRPVAGNDSAAGRAKNRRVELTLAPLAATSG
jgi:outer membrane protein OmpA-like peptidoglycan-associated protein